MNDWMMVVSILNPEAKKRRNAKMTEMMIATFMFLYCLALMVLSSINLVRLNRSLTLNSPSKIRHSILDWKMLSKMIAPKIMQIKIELKSMV